MATLKIDGKDLQVLPGKMINAGDTSFGVDLGALLDEWHRANSLPDNVTIR